MSTVGENLVQVNLKLGWIAASYCLNLGRITYTEKWDFAVKQILNFSR